MKFAVVGNPIEHSLSPVMHQWVFQQLGLHSEYVRIKATSQALKEIIQAMKNGELNGFNVTLPFKQEIITFLDDLDGKADTIKAVNCVVKSDKKLVGYNTDWYGFMMTLQQNSLNVQEKTCVLLGAGGAASSVLFTLLQKGAKKIFVANRTPQRAKDLMNRFSEMRHQVNVTAIHLERIADYLPDHAVVINCTPIGMTPHVHATPLPLDCIHDSHILMDTIYTPLETRLLRDGKRAGARTIGGLDMFIYQGLASLDLWFGRDITSQVDLKELKHYVGELCG